MPVVLRKRGRLCVEVAVLLNRIDLHPTALRALCCKYHDTTLTTMAATSCLHFNGEKEKK